MRIALAFRGLAYVKKYKHWKTKQKYQIDYRRGWSSFQKQIIDNHQVDTYFHTYRTPELDENHLLSTLSPNNYSITHPIMNINKSHQSKENRYQSFINSFRSAMATVENDYVNYDWIIITRFDLSLRQAISFETLDSDTIYYPIWCGMVGKYRFCDDNFFIIPGKMYPIFKQLLHDYHTEKKRKSLHPLYNFMCQKKIKNQPLIPKHLNLGSNPYYQILR